MVNAENASLDYINENMPAIDKNKKHYVHCAGGYRSMTFISILRAREYNSFTDIKGGLKSIKESGKFNTTDYVCPTTML